MSKSLPKWGSGIAIDASSSSSDDEESSTHQGKDHEESPPDSFASPVKEWGYSLDDDSSDDDVIQAVENNASSSSPVRWGKLTLDSSSDDETDDNDMIHNGMQDGEGEVSSFKPNTMVSTEDVSMHIGDSSGSGGRECDTACNDESADVSKPSSPGKSVTEMCQSTPISCAKVEFSIDHAPVNFVLSTNARVILEEFSETVEEHIQSSNAIADGPIEESACRENSTSAAEATTLLQSNSESVLHHECTTEIHTTENVCEQIPAEGNSIADEKLAFATSTKKKKKKKKKSAAAKKAAALAALSAEDETRRRENPTQQDILKEKTSCVRMAVNSDDNAMHERIVEHPSVSYDSTEGSKSTYVEAHSILNSDAINNAEEVAVASDEVVDEQEEFPDFLSASCDGIAQSKEDENRASKKFKGDRSTSLTYNDSESAISHNHVDHVVVTQAYAEPSSKVLEGIFSVDIDHYGATSHDSTNPDASEMSSQQHLSSDCIDHISLAPARTDVGEDCDVTFEGEKFIVQAAAEEEQEAQTLTEIKQWGRGISLDASSSSSSDDDNDDEEEKIRAEHVEKGCNGHLASPLGVSLAKEWGYSLDDGSSDDDDSKEEIDHNKGKETFKESIAKKRSALDDVVTVPPSNVETKNDAPIKDSTFQWRKVNVEATSSDDSDDDDDDNTN